MMKKYLITIKDTKQLYLTKTITAFNFTRFIYLVFHWTSGSWNAMVLWLTGPASGSPEDKLKDDLGLYRLIEFSDLMNHKKKQRIIREMLWYKAVIRAASSELKKSVFGSIWFPHGSKLPCSVSFYIKFLNHKCTVLSERVGENTFSSGSRSIQ